MKKYGMILVAVALAALGVFALRGGVVAKQEQASLSWKDFAEPAKEYRPLVRWWWPGNDVEEGELRREVDLLADNGFGGAEVQAFRAGLPKMSKE